MVRTDASQGNTMEQYTTPVPLPQRQARLEGSGDVLSAPANPEKPSCAELLAAIQGSRVNLEGKIETVAVDINLLRSDLRQVIGGVSPRASGVDGPDSSSRDDGQLEDTGACRSATDSIRRVEIQQDGTMMVVPTGLAVGLNVELEQGAESFFA
ncbi:hypothetical protein NDU88_006206 [Pleurodeles waltl]|uniref:Uncharacterized protein n=1 Tax=Pleurodeles waltl TaxID=8319 RepID=A0AAV7SP67_PLEWA|nr:hypothetical protein NDU88_006206 [Pleurodeles waltl]